jgi:hypothetical protein
MAKADTGRLDRTVKFWLFQLRRVLKNNPKSFWSVRRIRCKKGLFGFLGTIYTSFVNIRVSLEIKECIGLLLVL